MSMVLDKDTLAQPYFDIYINDVPISREAKRCVVSVEYEESDSDADLIRISVNDYSTTFADDTGLEKDAKVKLVFGHVKNYREVEGVISLIEADFTDRGEFVLSIVAIDKTNSMTSKKKTRTWKKVKRSDVVRLISSEYGFKAIVKDTGDVLDQVTQDDETDAQFIKKMAESEALQFYLIQESNTIYFDERFKDFKVRDTLYYNSGDCSIIRFKPNLIAKNKKEKVDDSNKDVSDNTGDSVSDSTGGGDTSSNSDLTTKNEVRNVGIDVKTQKVTVRDDVK